LFSLASSTNNVKSNLGKKRLLLKHESVYEKSNKHKDKTDYEDEEDYEEIEPHVLSENEDDEDDDDENELLGAFDDDGLTYNNIIGKYE